MNVNDLIGGYLYGMRALGAISGTYHTNTLEGYEHWSKAGIKFWETDVAITDDNKYVMIGHFLDRLTMNRMEINDIPEILTYDWYMKQILFPKSTRGLTPLSLEMVIELALRYPDTIYMLDLYPFSLDNSYSMTMRFLEYLDNVIGNNTELYDSIIIEIYNKDMIHAIREFGKVKFVQMSVSKFIENEGVKDINDVIQFFKENEVNVISYEWRYARKHPEHLSALKDQGFIFVSRSVTNLFDNGYKRKNGVNISLLDFYVRSPLDFIDLFRLALSRLQKKHG